jgi:hypothetical protein
MEKTNAFPTGKREMIFCAAMVIIGLGLANSILMGGFKLGFAIAACASICAGSRYLSASGHKGSWYTRSILALCLLIAAGFGYSGDSGVKAILFLFLLTGVNLALCQMAGQNRRDPGQFHSLLDAPRALFVLGLGKTGTAVRGIVAFFREGGESSRRTGAILAGLLLALPVLAVMVPLLMFADAAFEGLMDLLPAVNMGEIFATLIWGTVMSMVLYARGVALNREVHDSTPIKARRGLHLFTVNTLLFAVCALYLTYLFSQIAYFSGGFLGILPDGYSTAEYARRGFFEMAWLCAINLSIIACSLWLVSRQGPAPLSTRLACLFIGLITLFLVSASCAKMVLYIHTYGLTRLRVLTMAVITFLSIATVLVCIWLFVPKFQYMKAVILAALIIGATVLWMDVDATVARYNVNAYLSGQLTRIDTAHLGNLGNSALPYLEALTHCDDPVVSTAAKDLIHHWHISSIEDFRSWTYMDHRAWNFKYGAK